MSFLLEPGDPPSKREILGCALRLFVRDGLCETSIRAIGDAAGYTNPALYKFYPSKDALAIHLFERCYLLVHRRVVEALAAGRFRAKLSALVAAWIGLMDEELDAVLFMNESLRDFWPKVSAATKRRSLLGALRQWIEEGQAEGAVPKALDPALAVAMIVGTLGQVARQRAFGAFADSSAVTAQTIALLDGALTRSAR